MISIARGQVYLLLIFVIITWALAWPFSKIGLNYMTPIWYTAARLCVGLITIFSILLFQKKIILPKRRDLPMIISIGLLQMASFLLFINGGLLYIGAGRSAILVYSTPFLVIPIAILFFKEKLTTLKLTGLILGLVGFIFLFNPWSFNWHDTHVIIGNVLLLIAALFWAITMIHIRYGQWHTPSLLLVPWQLLLASIVVIISAFIVEPHPEINWTPSLLLTIFYNGILATGFAYPAIIYVSKNLPVTTTSLLLLSVPVLGLIFSAWWLHEALTWEIITAMILILFGLACVSGTPQSDALDEINISTR